MSVLKVHRNSAVNAVECLQLHGKRVLLTAEVCRTADEHENLFVLGMSSTDATHLLFADEYNRSVKRVTLQSREVQRVYRSEWRVLNVLQIEDGKSLMLLESNPANEGI